MRIFMNTESRKIMRCYVSTATMKGCIVDSQLGRISSKGLP